MVVSDFATKRNVLKDAKFGHRVAEEERRELINYFVETDQWSQVYSGEVDIVYGPKGSGKSAFYFAVLNRREELREKGVLVVEAENPTGTPVFKDLADDPNTSETEFSGLWKLYFLSLIGGALREHGLETGAAETVTRELERANLLPKVKSLKGYLRSAVDYLASIRFNAFEGGLKLDPTTGLPSGITGKITLKEPSAAHLAAGYMSADYLLQLADEALSDADLSVWLVIDRLDVAFAGHEDLEKNALRSLFKVYSDLRLYDRIRLKIFIRDDIWRRITTDGFREASHLTKTLTIKWDASSLMNLVIRRILNNREVCVYYNVDKDDILQDFEKQEAFFYRFFPEQVDTGTNQPKTFGWLVNHTRDGLAWTASRTRKEFGAPAPRELIHLLTTSRDVQVKKLEIGKDLPAGENLIGRSALKDGMFTVSKVRLEQTLFAEYPHLQSLAEKLQGLKSEQTLESLSQLWQLDAEQTATYASALTDAGFFDRRGEKQKMTFWVPFLYRPALNLLQGKVNGRGKAAAKPGN